MAVKINTSGRANASSLIGSGKVDKTTGWSFSAEDGNKILGDPPKWGEYGRWFLGVDDGAGVETKEHWKYPFGKNGKVYRSGLIAIRQRAGQQNETDIFNTAGAMIGRIDGNKNSARDGEAAMYVKIDEMERRCLPTSEVRLDGETAPKITGYAAVFGVFADIGGLFREQVQKGAFTKTLKEADVRALWNHNPDYVLGRNKAGTLKLWEDSKGLSYEIDPPSTAWANDLITSVKRGDVNQSSFGFSVNKQEVNYEKDERTLVDVTLYDVSLVCFPAYPTTTAQVRSLFQHEPPPDPPQWEELDQIISKIKAGEPLTDDEIRAITAYIPNLSVPPAKHTETPPEPPRKALPEDTRKGDKWTELYIRAEMQIPSKN
jgi:HK97 family phage prohead protease